ncbi:MAG: hypothetical protein IT287_08505 [Bdellovibrionaceae bacterium]|nr:hypothetical protein [Pseudobdellovibrionaceae bacterium]
MDSNKSPMVKNTSTSVAASNGVSLETLKAMRLSKGLLAGGVIGITGALAVYAITQYAIFSVILAFSGVLFLGARQLVRKSLQLTEINSQLPLTSTENKLEDIRKHVSKCKFLTTVEAEGTQVARQAEQLLHQYKALRKVLEQKFDPSELTFARYIDSINDACLSVGENLAHSKSILEHLELTAVQKTPQWEIQKQQVQGLLKTTDEALVQLVQLFNSLNEITTKEKNRNQLEESMLQIKELADRAKNYSKQ